MKKLTKKQIGIIAVVAVVLITIIGCIIGFSLSKDKEEKEPAIELTDDKVKEVKAEDILESTEDYVVVNIDALQDLVGMKFVSGDDTTFIVTVDDKELVFTVGSVSYTIDGKNKEMKTPAVKNDDVYGVEVETVINDLGHSVTVSRIDGKVTDVVITRNENVKNESKEEDKTDATEKDTQSDTTDDTQGNTEEPVVTKTTMYAKSNVNVRSGAGTSNSQIGSLTKGQEVVKIGEENGWSKIEFNGDVGYVKSEYLSTEKVEINNTTGNNTSNNNNQTGNNTGTTTPSTPDTPSVQEPEKSPYAGMYKPYDNASVERFNQCGSILRGGKAGQYMQWRETFIDYFSGAIVMSNGNTDNAWMYVKIRNWSTNEGSEETAPTFDELPSLAKQCFVALAPEGGLELYNKVNSLILQYGDPRKVPSQGTISESIPGLTVTLTQGKAGIEIRFWAE